MSPACTAWRLELVRTHTTEWVASCLHTAGLTACLPAYRGVCPGCLHLKSTPRMGMGPYWDWDGADGPCGEFDELMVCVWACPRTGRCGCHDDAHAFKAGGRSHSHCGSWGCDWDGDWDGADGPCGEFDESLVCVGMSSHRPLRLPRRRPSSPSRRSVTFTLWVLGLRLRWGLGWG